MHCPRCGSRFDEGVRFCRECGLSLSGVTDLVAINDPEKEKASGPCDTKTHRGEVAMQGVGLIVFGVILWLVNGGLRSYDLYPEVWGRVVSVFFLVMGIVRLLYAAAGAGGPAAQARREARREARRGRWEAWEKGETVDQTTQLRPELAEPASRPITNELFRRGEPVVAAHSVTEHTTRQLSPDA